MNDITQQQRDAKMDARVASISSKIDGFLKEQAVHDQRVDAQVQHIAKSQADIVVAARSMKATIMVTGFAAVLAILVGVAGFNALLTSKLMPAHQVGASEYHVVTTPNPEA